MLPRSEYDKYFAKDKKGNYTGTEPQREWTENELDEKYGKYKNSPKANIMSDISSFGSYYGGDAGAGFAGGV